MSALEHRVARLTRRVHMLSAAVAVLLLLAVLPILLGAARHPTETVRVHAVEVVDVDGNVVVRLGAHHRGSGYLEVRTREGQRVVAVSALRGEGYIATYRDTGELLYASDAGEMR